MHKLISAIILLALSIVSLNAFSAADKVELCHKGQEVNVASSSLSAHTAHGDWEGDCDEGPAEPEPETMTTVVIMRCEAGLLVSLTHSDKADAVIQPIVTDADCPQVLDVLLNAGFVLRSITSGSAQDGGSLDLYTDYLLFGKIPVES